MSIPYFLRYDPEITITQVKNGQNVSLQTIFFSIHFQRVSAKKNGPRTRLSGETLSRGWAHQHVESLDIHEES